MDAKYQSLFLKKFFLVLALLISLKAVPFFSISHIRQRSDPSHPSQGLQEPLFLLPPVELFNLFPIPNLLLSKTQMKLYLIYYSLRTFHYLKNKGHVLDMTFQPSRVLLLFFPLLNLCPLLSLKLRLKSQQISIPFHLLFPLPIFSFSPLT